ncbi:MAG: hypothetical protein WD271_06250 [Acidimicrobiia bacterium]
MAARTILYEVTVSIEPDTFSYNETTTIEIAKTGTTAAHTNRNILRRVG